MDEKKFVQTTVEEVSALDPVSTLDYNEKIDDITVSVSNWISHDREAVIARILESDDMDDLANEDADFIIDKMETMDPAEAIEILREAEDYHSNDINFPALTLEKIRNLLEGPKAYDDNESLYDLDLRLEASMMKFYSPYPEVRSVCRPTDDPSLPVETFRSYLVGIIWVAVGAFVNQLMSYRRPSFTLSSQVIQILIYPSGKFLQYVLPKRQIGVGRFKFHLNPGPWSQKEQLFATIVTNVGAQEAVFMSYMPTMRLSMFYNQTWMTYGFSIIMGLSCQFFGYGMSGCLRRYAVYPVKAVWPTVLPVLQLNRTLCTVEQKKTLNGWTITKYKLFFILLWASLIYFFVPDYLFEGLSTFNWMTWIAPNNKNLAFVTGSLIGAGFNPIVTFDWSVINYSSCLVVPFYVTANRFFGCVMGGIVLLILYYTNYKYTAYMPPNTSSVFDRFGESYNTSRVLVNGRFDLDSYIAYSPPYVSAGQLMYQATAYLIYTFAFVYIFITEWSTIKEAIIGFYQGLRYRKKSTYERYTDPISVLMRQYPEVPDWWYLILLAISIVFGIIAVACYPAETPVWVVIVAILVTIALLIPFIVLYSTTGYFMSINNLGTILGGYMVPGSGLACIFTRTFAYGVDERSETVVGDLKLAHYGKIPPRAVFRGQVLATIIMIFITSGAVEMLITGSEDFCSWTNPSKFVCTFAHTLYADSLLMGVIGPHRTFDQLYPTFKWAFLIGACISAPIYVARKYSMRYTRYFHPVIFLGGIIRYGSTYNLSYYTEGFYASFIFMYYLRTRYLAWWSKYNYIISSGLTAGVAFGGILIFLALQYHPKTLDWWGNSISDAGIDGAGDATLKGLPEIGYFGLEPGSWS
ncbi:OPT oligopeptide transporter protein-domain-containing protein [Lipomyces oligophaga]|uniref:OPT oligopeptide transporter protein-domain-containing protein n=1 Tax=Lipomyces oligophaga TaxID=45792 RepID=UPI0034CD7D7D